MLKIYEKKVQTIVEVAKEVKIKDEKTMAEATKLLTDLNVVADKITEEKEKVTKPLNEALKAERARWKPVETLYEEAIGMIRGEMSRYQTEMIRKAREEEKKISERIGEGKGKLKIETAVKKIESIDRPSEEVKVDGGKLKFRTDTILKVTDMSKIPDKYFVLNDKALLADLKNGIEVPGATTEEIQTPVNYR